MRFFGWGLVLVLSSCTTSLISLPSSSSSSATPSSSTSSGTWFWPKPAKPKVAFKDTPYGVSLRLIQAENKALAYATGTHPDNATVKRIQDDDKAAYGAVTAAEDGTATVAEAEAALDVLVAATPTK